MPGQYFPRVITGLTVTRSGWCCMARVLGNLGTPITVPTISEITYSVRSLTAATTVVAGQDVSPSAAIYNSLVQDDPRWVMDSEDEPSRLDERWGYNFLHVVPAAYFTSFDVDTAAPFDVAPHRMAVHFLLTPVTGEPFVIPFESTPVPTYIE